MIDLVETYRMEQKNLQKNVGNHVISSIYRRAPAIFGGFPQYSEYFSTKSVQI
jgi:hypothetical protein